VSSQAPEGIPFSLPGLIFAFAENGVSSRSALSAFASARWNILRGCPIRPLRRLFQFIRMSLKRAAWPKVISSPVSV